MEKQEYMKPMVNKVAIDNEISVVLMSQVGSDDQGDPPGFPVNPTE